MADRVVPVLLFVAAMTVLTELVSEAGLFVWIARRLRHWGRGRSVLLWLLIATFAVVATVFLSLDTTAVLLTPVVVSVARQAGLPALPIALTTVWLANTASLLLPISNLSNLLAQHTLGGISPAGFASLMRAPAAVAVVVPLVFIGIIFRRSLAKRYSHVPVSRIRPVGTETGPASGSGTDKVLLGISSAVLVILLSAVVSWVTVWIPAAAAAVVLAGAFLDRRPKVLTPRLVPWPMLLFASGLFLVMETLRRLGAPAILGVLAGNGSGTLDLIRLAAAGAALLIGVNAGPLITPWAGYALFGLIVAPATVLGSVLVLAAVGI